MKQFDIPDKYRSGLISKIKQMRKLDDPRKKDYSPTIVDLGSVVFLIARHFGFCYGVENAIEIAYKTIEENPEKNIYLLSEMIHNPGVNEDLMQHGVKFLMDTNENYLIDFDSLKNDDIVIIPAFGTTIDIEKKLKEKGIDPYRYNTTCPFVEKVWNRAENLGKQEHTIIIHGKYNHEETRATFSHSSRNAPTLIIRDINEAEVLAKAILGEISTEEFYTFFAGKYSQGFDLEKDLIKVGVVNQTTMLATETQEIAELIKSTMIKKYGNENLSNHFADTRDTLCYATNDNQNATIGLMNEEADFAIVVGGYNSSNTSHLVELLENKFPTYFIYSEKNIISANEIRHFSIHSKIEEISKNYIQKKDKVRIAITSGASCPDAVVDKIIEKLISLFPDCIALNKAEPK